jgi:chemotaxis protein MotB
MALVEEEEAGVPAWVVTFGDMMSLLLTFFIMLVSMSEIKQDEYQAMVDALRRRFGHDTAVVSPMPGPVRPRNSKLSRLSSMGRARRLDTMRGGDKVRAPVGDSPRVQQIRPAGDRTQGGMLMFDQGSAELTEADRHKVAEIAKDLLGKPQKIEIRGHTSTRPLGPGSSFRNHWDLAYARCYNTMQSLVKLGINRKRITIGVAADNEPLETAEDPQKLQENSRVEIFMLSELAEGLEPAPKTKPRKPAPGGAR